MKNKNKPAQPVENAADENQTNEIEVVKEKKKVNWKKAGITTGISAASLILCAVCVGVILIFFQNQKLIETAKNANGESIHTIYDDTDVINAYKTGDDSKLNEQDKFVLTSAEKVIKSCIKEKMTDYEKELAIYNWQVKYVAFDNSSLVTVSAGGEYSYLPYGVLKYHNAICVGNATTFKLFMDMLGIECKIIHSTQNGEHAWNMVKIDGDWYHADVTFDGGTNGSICYSYFNVPDSMKENGSYPWDESQYPAATSIKHCYLYNNCVTANTVYDIPSLIGKAMKNGEGAVNINLKNSKNITPDIMNFIGNTMGGENSAVMYGQAFALGGKVICQFTINTSALQGNGNKAIDYDKLQNIISKALKASGIKNASGDSGIGGNGNNNAG